MRLRKGDITVPTIVTLTRVAAIPFIIYFAYLKQPVAAGVFLGLAGLSDFLDGMLARALKQETRLGAKLDSIADTLVVLAVIVAFFLFSPDTFRKYWALIIVDVVLHIVQEIIVAAKFKYVARTHLFSEKIAMSSIFVAIFVLLIFGADWIVMLPLILGIVCHIEGILVMLTRKKIDENIRSIFDSR